MKLYPKIPIIIFLLIIGYLSISCDCTKSPIEKHIKDTKYIITAEVTELLDEKKNETVDKLLPKTSHKVKVSVISSYKGGFKKAQILELGSDYSDCSFIFKPNHKYLLFLEKNDGSNKYYPIKCSYNEELDQAGSSIKKIEKQLSHKSKK